MRPTKAAQADQVLLEAQVQEVALVALVRAEAQVQEVALVAPVLAEVQAPEVQALLQNHPAEAEVEETKTNKSGD